MKVLVAGVGGIGGWLSGVLARGGADVEVFARGATLEAIRRDGLVLRDGGRTQAFRLAAHGEAADAQRADIVFVAVKAQDFGSAIASLKPALAHGPRVVAAVNGLPWWFLSMLRDGPAGVTLESVDADGACARALSHCRPIGAVVHASAHLAAPGVVDVAKADRLILGDVDGAHSELTRALSRCVEAGGVSCPVVDNIHMETWAKLWGNMNINPISALTRLTAGPIHATPELLALVEAMMREFADVGARIGLPAPMSVPERMEITLRLGDFTPSMLKDTLAGRRLEVDGILGSFVELAQKIDAPAPVSAMMLALLRGLDQSFARAASR